MAVDCGKNFLKSSLGCLLNKFLLENGIEIREYWEHLMRNDNDQCSHQIETRVLYDGGIVNQRVNSLKAKEAIIWKPVNWSAILQISGSRVTLLSQQLPPKMLWSSIPTSLRITPKILKYREYQTSIRWYL